ncbi:HNH endonuclease signature motif containing protein, partial [Actinotalea caeni]
DTIRDWCGEGATRLSVRPVLDLDQPQRADTYHVPDRIREQVRLRDGTCVFPGCHAPGLRCQHDHIDPYDHDHPDTGGQTQTTNLALLCQRHHTLKTHHGFTYTLLTSGTVLWRTPHGLRIHRHPDGTTHIDGLPDTDPTRLHGAAADNPGAATPSTRANVDTDTAEVCDPPDP